MTADEKGYVLSNLGRAEAEAWVEQHPGSGYVAKPRQIFPRVVDDWRNAGPLLDRLRAEGWSYQLSPAYATPRPVDIVSCCLTRDHSGLWLTKAAGASAPDAICLAFCLAKEAEKEEIP